MRLLHFVSSAFALLAGCASVPLATTARLAIGQETRIIESPAQEVAVAVSSNRPLPDDMTSPVIFFGLRPRVSGAFKPSEEVLTMERAPTQSVLLGPDAERYRYVFVLTKDAQQQLRQGQEYFSVLRARKQEGPGSGGSLTIAINLNGFFEASKRIPADTKVSTWLRTSHREGFLKAWAGTAGEGGQLLQAEQGKAAVAQ